MAGARDEIAERDQVVDVPDVVRVLVKVHSHGKNALLVVDDFFDNLHFLYYVSCSIRFLLSARLLIGFKMTN